MDVFMPIAVCVILIILFTICGWCCKRKREGTVYGYGPSVTVTSTTQHVSSPQVIPPYPIDPRHPTPATNAPGPGFATHQAPYPTHQPSMPFPQTVAQPYGFPPPPVGMAGAHPFHNGATPYPPAGPTSYPPAPYPPASHHDYSANPPPYDVAVSQPPIRPPPTKEVYGKQAPYNPGY